MWSDLFSEKSSSSPHEYSRSILTTWELSFQQIRRSNEDAACMLQLWTCLSPRDIWYELFIPILDDTEEIVPEWFERCMHNKVTFRQTAKVLLDYSLAEAEAGNSAYSVHPVVHDWCFNQELKDREATTSLAIHIVSSSIPRENDPEYWLLQRRLLPHAGFDWKNDLKTDSLSSPCETLGNLYTDQGKMAEAEEMYMRALKGYEKARGPEHTSTLDTVNNLGLLYADQGKMAEAEEMYMRALKGYEKARGPEHTATLTTANNLGNLYANQGKIAEAEEMFRKAKTHGQNIQQQESTNADIMSGQTTDSLSPYNRSEKEKNDIKGWWTRKKMRILKHRSRNQEDT
jgi:tetratricopeptide (TPR) repeat protein